MHCVFSQFIGDAAKRALHVVVHIEDFTDVSGEAANTLKVGRIGLPLRVKVLEPSVVEGFGELATSGFVADDRVFGGVEDFELIKDFGFGVSESSGKGLRGGTLGRCDDVKVVDGGSGSGRGRLGSGHCD